MTTWIQGGKFGESMWVLKIPNSRWDPDKMSTNHPSFHPAQLVLSDQKGVNFYKGISSWNGWKVASNRSLEISNKPPLWLSSNLAKFITPAAKLIPCQLDPSILRRKPWLFVFGCSPWVSRHQTWEDLVVLGWKCEISGIAIPISPFKRRWIVSIEFSDWETKSRRDANICLEGKGHNVARPRQHIYLYCILHLHM